MNQIKNLHLLTDIVSSADIEKMELAAFEHKRHSNITFKIIAVSNKKVTWEVKQEKSNNGHYFPGKRLIEIVKETYERFLPDHKFQVGPKPFMVPGPDIVTSDWVVTKMKETGTRLNKIANETGLDYPNLSTIIKGGNISQAMKAVFYYYFLSKEKP